MSFSNSIDLIPQAAFELQGSNVSALNSAARRMLPGLEPGDPSPIPSEFLTEDSPSSGRLTWGQSAFVFTASSAGEVTRVFLSPAPQTALSHQQLVSYLRQIRQIQGDLLLEFRQLSRTLERHPDSETLDNLAAFRQSFYQMHRMSRNLEFLAQAHQGEIVPQSISLDLSALCARLAEEAGQLLSQGDIPLIYRGSSPTLLVPGDRDLLSRAILGLLSNAAKHAQGHPLSLRLLQSPGRAILTLRQEGALSPRQLDDLLNAPTEQVLPLPGQGAGLGLDVVRHIVDLHRGTLLWRPGQDDLLAVLCLPTGPLPLSNSSVQTPTLYIDGGLDPVLLELCDALPAAAFRRASLE